MYQVFPNSGAVAYRAAEQWVARAKRGIASSGRFTVVLSGGSTPKRMFAVMAEQFAHHKAMWQQIHVFFGDERFVPADHAESNYRWAHELLLSKLEIPEPNIHRMVTEIGTPSEVAVHYEDQIKEFFGLGEGVLPRFDLVFLGMGADGHTASLFPDSDALAEKTRLVVAPFIGQMQTHRITLTLPILCNAAQVLFLVTGKGKAEIVGRIFAQESSDPRLPAQMVQPHYGELMWYLDEAAAQLLDR